MVVHGTPCSEHSLSCAKLCYLFDCVMPRGLFLFLDWIDKNFKSGERPEKATRILFIEKCSL